jgi:chromosome partitioning protein
MNDLQLVLVHNHKGGTGKTMIAVHLAEYLASQGQQWCLWDADSQANAMSWVTGHQWQGEDTIQIPTDGGAALTATVNPEDTQAYEHILIDTPPSESALEEFAQYYALSPSDLIVCPVNGRLSIDGAIKVAEEVEPSGCRVVLVPNLTDPRDGHAREEIKAIEELGAVTELNAEVFRLAIPRNEKYMRDAELQGIPIWNLTYARRTHTAQALEAFCEWIALGALPAANEFGEGKGQGYPVSAKLKSRLWNN